MFASPACIYRHQTSGSSAANSCSRWSKRCERQAEDSGSIARAAILIDHALEGRTEIVSAMRGNTLAQAAKCIVLMVKIGKKTTRYVLAVVPGDRRVDLSAIKALLGGTYVAFATPEIAERLAGSVTGTIVPFSFNPGLELIVDPAVLDNRELYFIVARLDPIARLCCKPAITSR
jgi:Ala-tRNA(Pro) deacylase